MARTSREMLEQLCAAPSPMAEQWLELCEIVECVDGLTSVGTPCRPAALRSASTRAPEQRWHALRTETLEGWWQVGRVSGVSWEQPAYALLCKEQFLPSQPTISKAMMARATAKRQEFQRMKAAAMVVGHLKVHEAAFEAAKVRAATTIARCESIVGTPPKDCLEQLESAATTLQTAKAIMNRNLAVVQTARALVEEEIAAGKILVKTEACADICAANTIKRRQDKHARKTKRLRSKRARSSRKQS
eukprot:COSAG01_NODE_3112_length_6569_cov_90.702318_3_plen_246_part_00